MNSPPDFIGAISKLFGYPDKYEDCKNCFVVAYATPEGKYVLNYGPNGLDLAIQKAKEIYQTNTTVKVAKYIWTYDELSHFWGFDTYWESGSIREDKIPKKPTIKTKMY